jgi:hypothetical protein
LPLSVLARHSEPILVQNLHIPPLPLVVAFVSEVVAFVSEIGQGFSPGIREP